MRFIGENKILQFHFRGEKLAGEPIGNWEPLKKPDG
jgi:hypothetical protein